jgi:titin
LGNDGRGILFFNVGAANSAGVIGGSTPGAGNLISGNGGRGIEIFGTCSSLKIQGNLIGTDVTGTSALGNNNSGIYVEASTPASVIIGGTTAATRNVVSANKSDEIDLQSGDQLS